MALVEDEGIRFVRRSGHRDTPLIEGTSDHLEEIDLDDGEYTAFDIDGQVLDVVARGDEWVLMPTGRYDLPRLIGLARSNAKAWGYELTGEDPLLEYANRDSIADYEGAIRRQRWWAHRRRRWLGRLLRREVDEVIPPPQLYTRSRSD